MINKLIQIPKELSEKLNNAAKENDRSVNKEITNRLKKSFKK